MSESETTFSISMSYEDIEQIDIAWNQANAIRVKAGKERLSRNKAIMALLRRHFFGLDEKERVNFFKSLP